MRIRMIFLALVALSVVGLGASGSIAAGRQANAVFIFRGELIAAPPPGANSLLVDVAGGNRRALRLMVGQSSAQSFAVGPRTQYLRWAHGVPTVVSQSNLAEGDQLTVRIRAPRGSSLGQVEATPASVVSDRGPNPRRPAKPLWLFKGTLNAPASGGRLNLHVLDGNYRALKGDAWPGPRPAVRLRAAHDLHPLAGSSADADLAEPARGRRSDQHPDPRPR